MVNKLYFCGSATNRAEIEKNPKQEPEERRKMFKSNKLKSLKSGEKLDFKFFNLQAYQVPKGWEKLHVSIICVETGKTMTKTGKASVKNGSCQWTEALTESISISRNDPSKEIEECLFKLVVSMGSVRSGILGEAMVNLASYRSSKTAIAVSLPLKKCNHGTILQVKIQCLTPRSQLRDTPKDDIVDEASTEHNDMDDRSAGSSSSNRFDSLSQAEVLSRDLSFSASSSCHSLDSTDDSLMREKFSPRNNITSIGRQDSTSSEHSYSPYGTYHLNDSSRSHHSKVSLSQRSLPNQWYEFNQVSLSHSSAGSTKDLLEAAEVKIEELRAEARMWEQNAQKLMTDVERLQEELSAQSNHQARLEMELSESQIQCESLKLEIERVNILLEESNTMNKSTESADYRAREMENLQKELERKVKFQRESNANLSLQLNKTQESNIELVCILQELEHTIEEQKTEIANLSKIQPGNDDMGNCSSGHESNGDITLNKEIPLMIASNGSAVLDLEASATEHEFTDFPTENNRITEQQMLELQESQKILQCTIHSLEKSLLEKIHEIEAERVMKIQVLLDCEEQWREKLAKKEDELIILDAKLSEVLKANTLQIKEAEVVKKKMDELVKDCNELTAENLELALQLKESKTPDALFSSLSTTEVQDNNYLCTLESELRKLKSQIYKLEDELKNKELLVKELAADHWNQADKHKHLEDNLSDLKISASDNSLGLSETLSELYEQINFCLADIKKQECSQQDQALAIINSFIELKHLFEAKFTRYKDNLKQNGDVKERVIIADESQNKLKENTISSSNQGKKSLQAKSAPQIPDSCKEIPVISDTSLKEQEAEALGHCPRELETLICNLQNEKVNLEGDVDVIQESHISTVNIHATELSELKISKKEVEVHLSELEKDNVHLSERICGLEAQLRYMTDERESSRLELQNTESCLINLQEEIRRLERDLEIQKDDHKKNMDAMKKQWLEVLEECEYLKVANLNVQTTTESLVSECSLLQKSVGDLKKQKMELNFNYALLEAELRESQEGFSDMSKLVEALEGKYCLMLEEVTSKEKALRLELYALLHDNKIKLSETNLSSIEMESLTKLSELKEELADSKQKQMILMADNEKLLDLLEDVKAKEEKHKNIVRVLQLKLKASVCEKIQLAEDISSLRDRLQKTQLLQKEILALKKSLNEVQFENRRLEVSIDMLIGDCEQLKNEKMLFAQKISDMQTSLSELDYCKRSKVLLEEKVLRLEGDITVREALCAQDAELKNELSQAKRANGELHRKIKYLQEENKRCSTRAQAFGMQLKSNEQELDSQKLNGTSLHISTADELKPSEVLVKSDCVPKISPDTRPDPLSNIQLLENKLAEALVANDMYKAQIKSMLGEYHQDGKAEEEVGRELRERQDRYLHMSLKCAQLEAERQQLVLTLKSVTNQRS